MSEKWYCVEGWRYAPQIKEVEVEKSTESSVWVVDRYFTKTEKASRCARSSDYSRFFPSLDDARKWVRATLKGRVDNARELLQEAERLYANVDSIKVETK